MNMDQLRAQLSEVELPKHIGIIMDGNGRWAKKRLLPRSAGHREGAETFGKIVRFARDCHIPYITFFTFSTENWKRPEKEVRELMELLHKFLRDSYKYKDENIRLRFLGDRAGLDPLLRQEMQQAEEGSASNTGITVNMALNYGGRDEIVRAAQKLCQRVREGELMPQNLDEAAFSAALDTAGMPDCDLIIRPSGEQRISNFMLWQTSYAELIFMDVLWPDFTEEHFLAALKEYTRRSRRFGGV